MLRHGHRPTWVIGVWVVVAVVSGLAAAIGYGLLGSAPGAFIALVDAWAHVGSDRLVGLMTAAGSAVAAWLSFSQ